MRRHTLRTIRLALGITTAVVISYGIGWPLSYLVPILTVMFLALPAWITWPGALKVLLLLAVALSIGVLISEFVLHFPLLCVPLYALLFFMIYYNDTPGAPPLVPLFMTMGITMIPIISFNGTMVSHLVAMALLFGMAVALFIAWIFHSLLPDSLAKEPIAVNKKADPGATPQISEKERVRLALVSTIVASTAVLLFFALNLSQYALAMLYICIMAGTPDKNASVKFIKGSALATAIGGIAVIIAYNLLVISPTYLFLVFLVLLFSLLFSERIYSGAPLAPAFQSGFTTFLVLLGSSTGSNDAASSDFYLRIAQILFAGLFTVLGLVVVENLLRPCVKRQFKLTVE
ncbi:MAG: DUF2955 domain-containing protein [Desulfocapsaceae bacterium]